LNRATRLDHRVFGETVWGLRRRETFGIERAAIAAARKRPVIERAMLRSDAAFDRAAGALA
jgi:hypothetical protein